MMISRKALPRRTVLRGIGTTLALPLLDGMVPALTALSRTAARPVKRLGVVYVPNGIVMEQWTPAAAGRPTCARSSTATSSSPSARPASARCCDPGPQGPSLNQFAS